MRRIPGVVALLLVLLLSSASAAFAARPANAFNGTWVGTDPGDGSNVAAVIVGDKTTQITYTDDGATSACADASTSAFTSQLIGRVSGDVMISTMTHAKCGTDPLPWLHGLDIEWFLLDGGNDDPADDVLVNSFAEEFTRAD
jgi:hypothetical protein